MSILRTKYLCFDKGKKCIFLTINLPLLIYMQLTSLRVGRPECRTCALTSSSGFGRAYAHALLQTSPPFQGG